MREYKYPQEVEDTCEHLYFFVVLNHSQGFVRHLSDSQSDATTTTLRSLFLKKLLYSFSNEIENPVNPEQLDIEDNHEAHLKSVADVVTLQEV
jgi:hypothetical protein